MKAQYQHVQQTIKPMVDETRPIIDVANKCDLVQSDCIPKDAIAVSATNLTGVIRIHYIAKKLNKWNLWRIASKLFKIFNIYRDRFITLGNRESYFDHYWTITYTCESRIGQSCGELVVQNDDSDKRSTRS